jgi:hypothetical protein
MNNICFSRSSAVPSKQMQKLKFRGLYIDIAEKWGENSDRVRQELKGWPWVTGCSHSFLLIEAHSRKVKS